MAQCAALLRLQFRSAFPARHGPSEKDYVSTRRPRLGPELRTRNRCRRKPFRTQSAERTRRPAPARPPRGRGTTSYKPPSKRNDVKLVAYVPDKVFTPLIKNLHADKDFLAFATAREEEALGILSGAWMGGRRGAVLMQTSGFGTIPNALASLVVPYQIPAIMFVSERGTLGE